MTSQSGSEFREAFRARREHCRALLELSGRQRDLIEADDYAQLLGVLGRKQRVLEGLQQWKGRYPRLLERWRTLRDGIEPELREQCEGLLQETEAMLEKLVEEEQASTERLTRRRDLTRAQLRELAQGAGTNEAYRDAMAPATSRHLDVNR